MWHKLKKGARSSRRVVIHLFAFMLELLGFLGEIIAVSQLPGSPACGYILLYSETQPSTRETSTRRCLDNMVQRIAHPRPLHDPNGSLLVCRRRDETEEERCSTQRVVTSFLLLNPN